MINGSNTKFHILPRDETTLIVKLASEIPIGTGAFFTKNVETGAVGIAVGYVYSDVHTGSITVRPRFVTP